MRKKSKNKNATKNEHIKQSVETVYFDVEMKKKPYSKISIYKPKIDGKVTLKKRWHVYFYWRDENTGKFKKKFQYQKGINRYKTLKEREAVAKSLKQAIESALQRGWNPVTKNIASSKKINRKSITLEKALAYAYKILEANKAEATLNGYNFHLNRFKDWAYKNGYLGLDVKDFDIDKFYEFWDFLRFDYVNQKTKKGLSGTSINNHKRSLSSLFTILQDERFIPLNFIKQVPKVDQEPVNNKAFTVKELDDIKKYILKNDPYLLHFLRFMIYPILRPIEICRLKVGDIDIENFFLSVKTKTELLSYRRLIHKIKPTLNEMQIDKYPANYHLFTAEGKPAEWNGAKLKSRVDHFSKRFRDIKNELGYGRYYSLYSVRHTAILNLYNSLVDKGMGEQEILFKLMPLTGHRSVSGIKNYLRKHKRSIPADHSDIYTLDI
ncbi:site-specific integrase [Mesonia sp. HuA40]|uniref:tyrosine-type recombinase/integrase n=1 Tax=Mesonia sp. HuA40 TaxID=2602761 RepID=UPI0011C79880|nr:site-specific integrase [Mesonia sp. HuA40]TXK73966.1 site-specific integrase [Mesonia sp. HuA40]